MVEETKSEAAEPKNGKVEEEQQLAQLINNEYSLEEIIYQLARILFSQSLHQGTSTREPMLPKFNHYDCPHSIVVDYLLQQIAL